MLRFAIHCTHAPVPLVAELVSTTEEELFPHEPPRPVEEERAPAPEEERTPPPEVDPEPQPDQPRDRRPRKKRVFVLKQMDGIASRWGSITGAKVLVEKGLKYVKAGTIAVVGRGPTTPTRIGRGLL